jgi:hypothetical protein
MMTNPMFEPTMSVLDAYPARARLRRVPNAPDTPATPKPEEIDTVEIETIDVGTGEVAEPRNAGDAGFAYFFPEAARAATRPIRRPSIPRRVTLEVGARSEVLPESADADLLLALAQIVLVGGSDLHVTANAGPTLRVAGRLQPVVNSEVWSYNKVTAALHSILTPEQETQFTANHELDLVIALTPHARFHVSLYQRRGAVGGTFRLAAADTTAPDFPR